MFGYIKIYSPELLVKEDTFYRAAYCGLCHYMNSICKLFPLTLSYDFTFLSVLRMGISDEKISFKKKRCIVHPFKKKVYVEKNDSVKFSCSSAAFFLHCKFNDDYSDNSGIKRIISKIGMNYSKKIESKLEKKTNISDTLKNDILDKLSSIYELEKNNVDSVYLPADLFGDIMGSVFSYEINEPDNNRCLFELGKHIGRWIYIIDAFDDLESDIKKGSYNPFAVLSDYKSELFPERILDALKLELRDAGLALELLKFNDQNLYHIVKNVIYFGLPKEADRIYQKNKKYLQSVAINREINQ